MAIHLPECVQHFPPGGTTSSHNVIKDYPPYKLAYAFAHMHSHACAHTHTHTHTHLMKMLASCPHAHKETAPNSSERRGGEAIDASFIHHDRGRMQSCGALQFSAGRKKKLIGKKKKREGTEQIEPFHHTLTSFTSAGIAKSFLLPHK